MKKPNLAALSLSFLLGGLLIYILGYRNSTAWATENKILPDKQVLTLQSAFRRVSAQLPDSVVEITVEMDNIIEDDDKRELPWGDFFNDPSDKPDGLKYHKSKGMGSGVIIDRKKDEYSIVTNSHVIGMAEKISVRLNSGQSLTGRLVGKDDRKDLALIAIQYKDTVLPVATLGDSDTLYVGDIVLAIGSPFGYESSVTLGIVSAVDRRYGPRDNINDFIQTDASINQGNSGGPLVNIHGDVIGINTFITTPNNGSVGLGFATPSNNVKSFVRQLTEYGYVRYGWLGVSMGAFSPEAAQAMGYDKDYGVMVYQIFIGSPADKAEFQAGDIILTFNERTYADSEDLIYQIGDKQPGESVQFTIDRFGRQLEINVVLGERGNEKEILSLHDLAWPGFLPAALTGEVRELMKLPESVMGIPVAQIYPRSHAQAIDLRPGDIITNVNGRKIDGISSLYLALGEMERTSLTMRVYRSDAFINLEKGEKIE